LGFRWTVAEASGLDSIVWREQWEDTHDDSLKAKLLDYNRDDCSALRAVTEFIASIASYEEKRDTHSNPAKIVHTADLQTVIRKHRFGRQEFCLPDLKFVNNCAYFNYQRDKVSVRTSKRLLSTSFSSAPKRRHHAKVNKRIDVRCKRCVHCNSRRLSEGRTLSRRTVDMKFFGGGIKKWVTVYSSRKYRCDKCGKTFMPPEYPQTRNQYGDGLAN
jgi:DNA-directed RNA polymerase subunit RPC12/RpoP